MLVNKERQLEQNGAAQNNHTKNKRRKNKKLFNSIVAGEETKTEDEQKKAVASEIFRKLSGLTVTPKESENGSSTTQETKLTQERNSEHSEQGFTKAVEAEANSEKNYTNICRHVHSRGFMSGLFSDIQIVAFNQKFHLHRLMLLRSSFFERVFSNPLNFSADGQSELISANFVSSSVFELRFKQAALNPESLALCFSYIYGGSFHTHISLDNVHVVMSMAYILELEELVNYCVNYIKDASEQMEVEFILKTVGWICSGFKYGSLNSDLKKWMVDLLSETVPKKKKPFGSRESMIEVVVGLYSKLPFDWIKEIMEDKMAAPKELDKFQMGKLILEQRKQRGVNVLPFCQTNTSLVVPLNRETVVLLFDRDQGGRVFFSENVVKKQLMKTQVNHSPSNRHLP